MMTPSGWPARCTLMGCTAPLLRPHHHHMTGGHLVSSTCTCPQVDQPGTSPAPTRAHVWRRGQRNHVPVLLCDREGCPIVWWPDRVTQPTGPCEGRDR